MLRKWSTRRRSFRRDDDQKEEPHQDGSEKEKENFLRVQSEVPGIGGPVDGVSSK